MFRFSIGFVASFCFIASSITFVRAQQPATIPEPAFEVASIRPVRFTVGCYGMSPPIGDHFVITCTTLRELVALAWKIHPDNIRGGDSSALSSVYDLSAVIPKGQPWTQDSFRPMLRRLLEERFHISVHPDTKQVSGYQLVVFKDGPKLKPAKYPASQEGHKAGEPFQNSLFPGYIRIRGLDLPGIASMLAGQLDATVVDGTGISGVFDIDLHFAADDSSDSNWPSFPVAVQQQLGLKLQPQKITVNTLVIDHVDDYPTPN